MYVPVLYRKKSIIYINYFLIYGTPKIECYILIAYYESIGSKTNSRKQSLSHTIVVIVNVHIFLKIPLPFNKNTYSLNHSIVVQKY